MSPRRAFACLSCCVLLAGAPLAAALAVAPGTPSTQTSRATPTSPRKAGSAPVATGRKTTRGAKKTAPAKAPGANCDVPATQTKAVPPPVPVTADPLAPSLAPCPPGAAGATTP